MNLEGKIIISVTELNKYAKRVLDSQPALTNVFLRGEISNLSTYASGHLYFTLKDENAQISATMFYSYVSKLKFVPENGMKVVALGRVSLYEARGTYQINITEMEPDGFGLLALKYEKLKKKLEEQGYFDDSHKKPLPKFPNSVGVITSPTGAAICDIVNILSRRWPICQIKVYPAIVQGNSAPESLIKGVNFFNEKKNVDVIIIGRGGGSIEDLWGFNDEMLVKTIYSSKIPIISAVGHESDFTLCDYVSDKRAPTPSAAAELAVPNKNDMLGMLELYNKKMNGNMKSTLGIYKEKLNKLSSNRMLSNPMLFIMEKQNDFAHIEKDFLTSKNNYFEKKKEQIDDVNSLLNDKIIRLLENKGNRLSSEAGKLSTLNPLKIVSRGYSVVYKDGKVVKEIKKMKIGDKIEVSVSDGKLEAEVSDIRKNDLKKG